MSLEPWPLFQISGKLRIHQRVEGNGLASVDVDATQKGCEDISGRLYDHQVSYLTVV